MGDDRQLKGLDGDLLPLFERLAIEAGHVIMRHYEQAFRSSTRLTTLP